MKKEMIVFGFLLYLTMGISVDTELERWPPHPPHPPPPPSPTSYNIYLQNQCPVTLFFAASGPSVVEPLYGAEWKADSGQNVTINIPSTWLHTEDQHHHRSLVVLVFGHVQDVSMMLL
jgi:hypothetical protein